MRRITRTNRRTPTASAPLGYAVAALTPRHWYRADTHTLSGANLATAPNRGSAGGHLSVAVGTLAAPAASTTMGGRPVVTATGSQYLESSLPPSAFRFLHDGTGCTIAHVYDVGDTSSARILSCTISSTTGHDFFGYVNGSVPHRYRAFNAGAGLFDNLSAGSDTGPTFVFGTHGTAASPQRALYPRTGSAVTGSAGSPAAGDPQFTFRLLGGNGVFFDGQWAETLLFDRVLSSTEREIVANYLRARYRSV